MVPRAHVSLPPNGISISLAVFAQLTGVPSTDGYRQTDTQTTLHATSIAVGHIYALRAGDAA